MIRYHPDLVTQGYLKSRLNYDAASGVFVWINPPHNHGRLRGAVAGGTSTGYRLIKINGKKYRASHLAWLYVTGEWPRDLLDHEDGDTLNDAIGNIREASHAQNNANARRKAGKILPKGVKAHRRRYVARIMFDKQLMHIGVFATPDEAAAAYMIEAVRLYGPFARAS